MSENKQDQLERDAEEVKYDATTAMMPSFEFRDPGSKRLFMVDPISFLAKEGQFFLIGPVTEQNCNELVLSIEAYKKARALGTAKETGDVTLNINSPGGSVSAGMIVYNFIQKHNADPRNTYKINTHCYGMAASMGSFLTMCGHKRTIDQDATYMIHRLSGGGNNGDKHTQEANGVNTDYTHEELIEKYCIHTAQDPEVLERAMSYENWFRGVNENDPWSLEALVEYGFVDEVVKYDPTPLTRKVKPLPEPRTRLNKGSIPSADEHRKRTQENLDRVRKAAKAKVSPK